MFGVKKMRLGIFIILLLSTSCASPGYRQDLLADGNTWKIGYGIDHPGLAYTWPGCSGFHGSAEECIPAAKPHIRQQGKVVCGKDPHRIYSCGVKQSSHFVECLVECNPRPQIEVSGESAPASPQKDTLERSTIIKAKKCQERGGVWVNDSCHILID
jgi:hypothetical protein